MTKSRILACFILMTAALFSQPPLPVPVPGSRVIVDAHNCYPYDGRWNDRVDRALATGLPVAIEQDLFWFTDSHGKSWSVVTHGKDVTGAEPRMRDYFFERIRPLMEKALRDGNRGNWPLITLNLDFKSNEPEHHAAVWQLLGEYEAWLTTAERSAKPGEVTPLKMGPLLVLTGDPDSQEHDFWEIVEPGGRLRVFGAVHTLSADAAVPAERVMASGAGNYRRWWNNPWSVVEQGGQTKAGVWTPASARRLESLVNLAHEKGLWIRFYTLNGHAPELLSKNGWDRNYNFGSRAAVELRWRAAIAAGVDYLATDQYEDLGAFLHGQAAK